MITRKQYKSAKDVKMYFDHSLAESDYHTQKGQIVGQWNGKGAALLGLSKEVEREDFRNLSDNIHPESNERLTGRTNKDRTVAEDFTFSVPKSVSIQYAISDDEDILKATNDAVQKTMEEIEKDALTRVRLEGKYENRPSQNLAWASFIHDDTRPMEQIIDGKKVAVPDPQVHVHNVIINATYDQEEEKWKAVNFRNCVANLPYYRQVFGNHLAQNLQGVGYSVERTSFNFEIAGYERSTIEKFSNRQRIIEETAAAKNI